jgi:hypothetical protein
MGYAGWHGVTDHLGILMAVSYEPIEGSLACRFITGEPVIHVGVPENQYQILLKSPYAGSYYRKYIREKYPCPYATAQEKYIAKEGGQERKRKRQNKERLERVKSAPNMEMTLFGEVTLGNSKSRKNMKHS